MAAVHLCALSMATACRRKWERQQEKWQRQLTLGASLTKGLCERLVASGVPLQKLSDTWVAARSDSAGGWGIGCEVCSRALEQNRSSHLTRLDMATFSCLTVRMDLLKRHQETVQHQKSVLMALDQQLGPSGVPLIGTPPLDLFMEALARLQAGESCRRTDQGGTGDRMKNIRFCLLEAMQETSRDFLRHAATMVLTRDERHGRLLIRYAACAGSLQTRHGTLAVMRDFDSPTAENLLKATKQAFKQFCTRHLGKPRSMPGLAAPKTDHKLLNHMRSITEMLVSDGASSELLSADLARGRRTCADANDGEAFTPNVKVVGRDLAHCARLVLRKPWQADPYLSSLFATTVWDNTAVVQIIDRSDVFRQWFKEYTAQESARANLPTVSNLSSAKHRFESCSKPLSRFVLHLVAVFKTCHRIVATRDSSSREGGLVRNWLKGISSEDLLQLALLADAADEGLLLVRQLDCEHFDLAGLQSSVGGFVERLDFLFRHRGCMTVESSFTQHCLRLLAAGQLQVLPASSTAGRVLTPPCGEAVDRCIRRMTAWAHMAKAAVEAEFPNFLVLNSFAVFALSDDTGAVAAAPLGETHWGHCQRLGQLFSVAPQELADQLSRLRPAAQAIKSDSKCSNQEAWRKAAQRRLQLQSGGNGVQIESLRRVLMRYLVWSCSTTGVEQRFSAADRLAVEKTPASQVHESLVLRAAFDKVKAQEKKAIARRAQELFAQGCPQSRAFDKRPCRLDKGTKRKQEASVKSEVGWLRKRRSTVAFGAKAKSKDGGACDDTASGGHLRKKQQECLAQQAAKKQRREEETFQDGCLLDSEVTEELRARVATRMKKDAANDRQRIAAMLKTDRKLAMLNQPVPWSRLGGLRAWVAPELPEPDTVHRHLGRHSLRVVGQADWAQADLFVIQDMDAVPDRVQWRAALAGCWVLTAGAAGDQAQGIFVKHHPAIHKAGSLFSPCH